MGSGHRIPKVGSDRAARRRSSVPSRVRVRAAIELGEVLVEMRAPGTRLRDHRGEACGLGLEDLDLVVDAALRIDDERAPFIRVARLPEPLAVPFARVLVLEQLADLRERESGVVAKVPDELKALEI